MGRAARLGPGGLDALVPRGKVLRDLFIPRLLAIEWAGRCLFVVLVA